MKGQELRGFIAEMDHPLVEAVWDIGHANMRKDNNQYEDILALGDKLRAVHIHDNYGECDLHSAPFTGTTDFDRVIRALIDIDFKGVFAFEVSNFPLGF